MSDAGSFDAGSFDAGSLGSVATDEGSALGSFAGSQVSHHDRERVSGEVALQRLIPGVMTWSHLDVRDQPPPRNAWGHVLSQRGMFTYTGLTSEQVDALRERFHIYMPQDGRISMASLTVSTCGVLARAIKEVLTAVVEEDAESGDALRSSSPRPSKKARV